MKMYHILLTVLLLASSCQKPVPEVTSMADPSGLEVEQTDLASVKLTWTDNAQGEKGYRVFLRGENDSFYVEPLETLDADADSYVFTGLQTGAIYDFGVQALSEDFKLHSQIVYLNDYKILSREELADQESVSKLAAPTDVVAVQTTNTTVSLTWKDAASGEKGYNIYKKEASEDSFGEPVATLDADVQSFEFKGLSLGSTYVFGVQATGQSVIEDSKIAVSEELTLRDLEKIPEIMEVKTSYAYRKVFQSLLLRQTWLQCRQPILRCP